MKMRSTTRCSTLASYYKKQKSAILLTQCIAEIVDNSIDARAKNIKIVINPNHLLIKVIDDGVGVHDLKAFWDFGNVVERPGIGAWGLGAKYAWAMLVDSPADTRLEFITYYKEASGKILGWQSYKDLSDNDANDFEGEPLTASRMGTGTELTVSNISKKFREIIRSDPHRLQNVLGMIYNSTLEKGEITMTVEIINEPKSEKISTTYAVTPFDLTQVAQGEILRKVYELEKGRHLTMTAVKICEESRRLVQHALMQDTCSGVFVEYRGRILCQLDLRNSLTLTSGLIVICNLGGTWTTNPNKSESIQGDENDLCLETIIGDLRIWADKNQENCASLKTNERLSKELNDLMDWENEDDCDCGAGDECKKTIVPKITRKGKVPNPSSTRKESSEKKDKSLGDKKKNEKAYEVKLVRAPLETCSQWSKDGKVLTITICSELYPSADLNVWGSSAPFYRDVMESFSRFKISTKRSLDSTSLYEPCDQSKIEPIVKKEMLEASKRKLLAKNTTARKETPTKG